MEDDDDFGALYSDVLRPFAASTPQPPHPSFVAVAVEAPSQPLRPPIDLNAVHDDDDDLDSDFADNGVVSAAPPSSIPGLTIAQTLAPDSAVAARAASAASSSSGGLAKGLDAARLLDSNLGEDDVTFDIEERDLETSEPVVPGLGGGLDDAEASRRDDGGEDWDSDDSEDDLQIVLNGPSMMERGLGDEDEDELVIVADGDPGQPMEDQDWGDDATQAGEGERKEMGEGGKLGSGASAGGPKVGYGNHSYHPFHSQFKYVRPGAAPIPGAATSGPGAVPGQLRPMVMSPSLGRGRGDWRPMGLKSAPPMQKPFQPWAGNSAGRGFGGGLDFTLPSHKSIFDIGIDTFEEKPWRYPTADISDFFNFGLNEDGWKDYCKQLEQLRLESTMQSKIRVYESGRTEQEYDPDLPPELVAATGVHEVPSENVVSIKSETGQGDLLKGSRFRPPPMPPGRAIQVETGCGERFPSIDTRPPRNRDSDAIIEIVLQDSDDSGAGNGVNNSIDDGSPKEDLGRSISDADIVPADSDDLDKFPHIDRKKKQIGSAIPSQNFAHNDIAGRDGPLPYPPKLPVRNGESQDLSSGYEDRKTNGRLRAKSPPVRNSRDEKYLNKGREHSVESMDSKHSPVSSSPVAVREAHASSVEPIDEDDVDNAEAADGISEMDKGDSPSDEVGVPEVLVDRAVRKLSPDHEPDDGAARSSDNSRARSGSSKDYTKRRDFVDEEVMQRHSSRSGGVKRLYDEKEQGAPKRTRDGKLELERNNRNYREFDPSFGHLQLQRKERDNPDWQRRDDESRRIRTEETRKRERSNDIGSRNRGKARETERIDKDELLYSRKPMDNGSHRAHYRERDDSMKGKYEHNDDYHGKRKRDEEPLRRDYVEKEDVHSHRENPGRRKRERDDVIDNQRKRKDNLDDQRLQRERGERGREKEEGQRAKPSQEENAPKRERDEGRGVMRGARNSEDKAWGAHTKNKDESKNSEKDYQYKETMRHSEPSKRRDREDQTINGERRSRQERSNTRNDRSTNTSDDQKVHDKKYRENTRRNKEFDEVMPVHSKRNLEDHGGQSNETALNSDEEQQREESRRGRSKLERWTSHKERDFAFKTKSSSSTPKLTETDRSKTGPAGSKITDEPPKPTETVEERDAADLEERLSDDRHLDTVEKLKKRSERFKLPMPSEKEVPGIKKTETEAPPLTKPATQADSEVKQERPARKRRWISG